MADPAIGLLKKYRLWLTILALVLYGTVLVLPRLMLLPLGDEALYILWSKWLSLGLKPYQDYFTAIFPGSLMLLGGIFKLTGPSVIAARMLSLLCLVLSTSLLLMLGNRFLAFPSKLLLLAFILIIGWDPSFTHHSLSGPLGLLSVYAISQYLLKQSVTAKRLFLFLAGVSGGWVLWVTQSYGVLLIAATLVFLLYYQLGQEKANQTQTPLFSKILPLACYLGGVLLAVIPGLLWLEQQGLISAFIQNTMVYLEEGHYSKTSSGLYFATGLLEIFSGNRQVAHHLLAALTPWSAGAFCLGWLPVLGVLWGAQGVLQHLERRNANDWLLFWWTLAGVTALAATLVYSTSYHIFLNGWIAYLLAAIALQAMARRWQAIKIPVMVGVSMVLLSVFLYRGSLLWGLVSLDKARIASFGTLESELVHPQGEGAALWDGIAAQVIVDRTSVNQPLAVFNSSPQLYLLANRLPAMPFTMLYPVMHSQKQIAQAASALNSSLPRVMIYDYKDKAMVSKDFRYRQHRLVDAQRALSPIYQLLNKKYMSFELEDRYKVFLLKSAIPTH